MQNTAQILPSECPVRITSGTYRNQYGKTISLPDEAGNQWVELNKAKGARGQAKQLRFTRGQLADMRPLPALPVVLTQRAAL
jgi:hypothetical protein